MKFVDFNYDPWYDFITFFYDPWYDFIVLFMTY